MSLESLASLVAKITLRHANQPDDIVAVRAAKPKALVFADAAEVEIVRTSHDYPNPTTLDFLTSSPPGRHLVAIALGSNLGDRFANIEAALRLLDQPELIPVVKEQGTSTSLAVVNTSFLYETAPMYVTDQPNFLNCACIVRSFQLYAASSQSQPFRLEPT